MKKFLCIILLLLIVIPLSSCAQGTSVREIISAMSATDLSAPAGKIYLSDAVLGEDEYISSSLRLALFGESAKVLDMADSFAIRLALVRSPYEYAVIKAKSTDGTDEIAKILAYRIDAARTLANRIGSEEEKAIANSAEIYVRGKYVILVMTDDNKSILNSAKKAID